jgi:uncharacterized protein (DUF427 family)
MRRREPPGPGQESVWDYPRPPRVEASNAHVHIELAGAVLADTRRSVRVLETSHPPVFYVPRGDVALQLLTDAPGTTFCEFKGTARYYDAPGRPRIGWWYPAPSPGYEQLADYVAFYPGRVDRATVDGEVVRAQAGDFYGGWITSSVTGPFKGGPETTGW